MTDTIKQTLSMDNVVRQYGFEPNRGRVYILPLPPEKTPSLKIYKQPGQGVPLLRAVGAGGSVIDFVMSLFGIPFPACSGQAQR